MALRRARDLERRGSKSTLLIVGLANPGTQYDGSRHNVGGAAVRLVVERRHGALSLERRQRALSATLATTRGPVTMAVPTTFMNESGAAIPPLLRRTSIDDLSELVIVHDELDLEPGRVQLKFGGGLAGHNGLRSIAQVLGTQDFTRVRIGIGKPRTNESGADYVLHPPSSRAQREALARDVAAAADALDVLLDYEFAEAQRRVNGS